MLLRIAALFGTIIDGNLASDCRRGVRERTPQGFTEGRADSIMVDSIRGAVTLWFIF